MLRDGENGHLQLQQFDCLDTAALQEILRADLDAPENDQLDMETIRYISNILAARRQTAYQSVEQSQAEFYADYYPLLENERALYDFAEPDAKRKIWPFPFSCWRKLASAVAVLVLLVFAGFGTAYALGYIPFDSVAKWDDEQFWFECVSQNKEKPEDLPDKIDVGQFLPNWLPEGFAFEEMHTWSWGDDIHTDLEFWRRTPEGDELLWVSYIYMTHDIKVMYEKDDTEMVVYRVNDIDHYIMSNLDWETIAWRVGNVEHSISGPFSLEEAKKIIDSLYWED